MNSKKSIHTPHDATFQQFLRQSDIARDFMEIHLPTDLRALCDFSTLQLECSSFVEDNLRQYFSDVLYSMKTSAGEQGYVHVLIEHQSTADKQMAFRLMRYAVAAMQRHLDAGYKTLPLVIPMLFYAGKRTPYPYSTNWLQGFSDPLRAGKLYSSEFPLVDVTVIPDDDIMEHRSMAALTLLQKHIRLRDLTELTDRLAFILQTGHLSSLQIASLIHYIIQVGNSTNAEAFVRELAIRVPQHEEKLMTIAQQLEQIGMEKGIKQGIEQGILQGIEQGIEQGMLKGREEIREIARSMLQHGIERSTVMKITALSEAELTSLSH